jgi:hypothetical protein
MIEGGQIRPFGPGRGMDQLGENHSQHLISQTGPPRTLLARAGIIARRDSGPRRQSRGRAKVRHLHARLGHPHLGGTPINARNRVL